MKPNIALVLLIGALCGSAVGRQPNIIVFYTDDHGYADLGCQGVVQDIRTPHLDALAAGGVRALHGYSTAPQCVPSRGGLLVGKFQGRFQLDSNGSSLDGFNQQTTIAQRLSDAGYATAQFGKWHLGPPQEITRHGFDHVFSQHAQRPFSANITLDGQDMPMGDLPPELYHIDGCSRAAAAIIERYRQQPFFLYIAYRAPHVPLDAPQKYLDRFPGKMPERRRQALAMLSAVDDGVGLITDTLKKHALSEQTLIFVIGDNGAPLKIHKIDAPGGGPGWDGSLNDPLNGEKGMLAEGGMHVPFLVSWPGSIAGGQTYAHPVSALDVAATAAAVAGIETQAGDLDGVNLVPYLNGEVQTPPHEALYWRWSAQSAIREGNWKLLRGGDREYLYDLASDLEEKHNLAAQHPEIADRLRGKLRSWCDQLDPPGLAVGPMAQTWHDYFDHYLEGKLIDKPQAARGAAAADWQARNATLTVKDGVLEVTTAKAGAKRSVPFLTHSGLNLAGPVTATITLKTTTDGPAALAWRVDGEKDFSPKNRRTISLRSGPGWQTHEVQLPVDGTLVHVRLHLPGGTSLIRSLQFRAADGKVYRWPAADTAEAKSTAAGKRPNVVLILADDLGWADTTLYGHTQLYETPNIDRLAQRGMTFTRAYAASPLCSPTRSAILTGLSPARTGLTTPNCHLPDVVLEASPGTSASPAQKAIQPKPVTRLKTEYRTLAESLQEAGYATGHFGKWHLGAEPYSPLEQGFDVDVPHWHGPGPAGSFVAPWKFPDFEASSPGEHIEDRMAAEAVQWMEANRDGPFFLNYWQFSVHAPFNAKASLIEKYKSRVQPDQPQRSPTYAAMIESMDDAVGSLLDGLDRLGIADETIIIFTSDNGGNMYNEVDGTTPTSNAPLRGGKATMFEGGVRVPCVIAWPGITAAGTRSDVAIQSEDFYPTLLDGLNLDAAPQQRFDGVSLLPALAGGELQRDAIFQYFPHSPGVPDWLPPAVSVHRGDWKLIRIFHGGDDGAHRHLLFNLRDDLEEKHDLAAQHPERVRELDALIEQFLDETGAVVPTPNPEFDPAQYHPELEGKAKPKGTAAAQAVAGWNASKHAQLQVVEGQLQITATGNDPWISRRDLAAGGKGPFTVRLRVQSNANGAGVLYFADTRKGGYDKDRSVDFPLIHDGQFHDYTVELPTEKLIAFRFDPGNAKGKITIARVEIRDRAGDLVKLPSPAADAGKN